MPEPIRPGSAAVAGLDGVAVHVARALASLDLVAPDVPTAARWPADVDRIRAGLVRAREALARADAEIAIATGLLRTD